MLLWKRGGNESILVREKMPQPGTPEDANYALGPPPSPPETALPPYPIPDGQRYMTPPSTRHLRTPRPDHPGKEWTEYPQYQQPKVGAVEAIKGLPSAENRVHVLMPPAEVAAAAEEAARATAILAYSICEL